MLPISLWCQCEHRTHLDPGPGHGYAHRVPCHHRAGLLAVCDDCATGHRP